MQKQVIKKGKNWVKLFVNLSIYSLSTIYSAGYVFLDRAYIYLDKDARGKIIIWLFPKNKKEKLNNLGMDFYNELFNYAHYFSVSKANAETIKLILQRALFSANPSMTQEVQDQYIDNLINEELGSKRENGENTSLKKR